jgi:hypothetical protein
VNLAVVIEGIGAVKKALGNLEINKMEDKENVKL